MMLSQPTRRFVALPLRWLATQQWLLPLTFAIAIYLGTISAPPHLMDDVDGVQAQIARNMLISGDWVTARLNGVVNFEKPPFLYWMIAVSYAIFGVSDWAARLPVALSAVALCLLVYRIGLWASGRRVGVAAAICLSTSVGLFLFSRVLFHDIPLTLAISLAMTAALRALEEDEQKPFPWAMLFWASMGIAVLIKGLIGLLLPVATVATYMISSTLLSGSGSQLWRRLSPVPGFAIFLVVAAPWHVLAIMRSPPHFDLSLTTEPVTYRGFFWFYLVNEHFLRFLNLRYPRDYTSIPRLSFLLMHVLWLFPWSVFLPGLRGLDYRGKTRSARLNLFAVCWASAVLIFFALSTRLEYYTLPAYPAFALLLGAVVAAMPTSRFGRYLKAIGIVASICLAAVIAVLVCTRTAPTDRDFSAVLQDNPELYTTAMGHLQDLTVSAFAYLRAPLVIAAAAFLVGATCLFVRRKRFAVLAIAIMMSVFFHAARSALTVFDPHMGSFELAEELLRMPKGNLIVNDHYFPFSSVTFYSNRPALFLNGRVMNLEYGSHAPEAPRAFIDDHDFWHLWMGRERWYLVSTTRAVARLEGIVGREQLRSVAVHGGKSLLTNLPIEGDDHLKQTSNAPDPTNYMLQSDVGLD